MLVSDTFELVCQVNGKVRDRVEAPTDAAEADLLALALSAPNMQVHLDGKTTVKEIVVPGRLVNIVVRLKGVCLAESAVSWRSGCVL
jgi:leucyl-tRNA synthetase